MRSILITLLIGSILLSSACREQSAPLLSPIESQGIFPKGELGPATTFTGKAWNVGLVAADSTYNTLVGDVYFGPGARSNWDMHPAARY